MMNKTIKPDFFFVDKNRATLAIEGEDKIDFLQALTTNNIEKISKEKNMSILLASHNMDEVSRLCKNILMMKDGQLIDQGTPKDLIKKHGKQNLEEVFLKLNRGNDEF